MEWKGASGATGGIMKVVGQRACKQCGEELQIVAKIARMGLNHGLLAFLCSRCEAAETVLITAQDWEVMHSV
jgi:hypothetical protein